MSSKEFKSIQIFSGERGEGTWALSALIFNVLDSGDRVGAPNFPPHDLGEFDDIKIAFFINTQNFWANSCVHYWNDISTNEIKFHILKVLFIFVTKSGFVVVISYRTIREYIDEHGDVEDQLNNWYKIAEKSDWANFSEVKQMLNSVDAVGNDLYVFNIKGNNYRLIVRIIFRVRTIYIKFIGTHKEYDKVILDDL